MTWMIEDWDSFYLDSELMPGRVANLTVTPSRSIEKVKKDGTDTPNTKDKGYDGATVELDLELWRSEQAATLGLIISKVSPRQAGGLATPHNIFHPITNAANVILVYVEKYTARMPTKGRMLFSIYMSEWFPEGEEAETKTGNAPPGGSGTGDGGAIDTGGVPDPDPANVGAKFT